VRTLLPIVALLAGCFNPSLGDAPFACGAGSACPDGYDCVSGVCRKPGTGPSIDARLVDASIVIVDAARDAAGGADAPANNDARPADARPADARPVDAPPIDARPSIDACVPRCSGDDLILCDGSEPTHCAAGCDDETGPPACLVLDPLLLAADTCKTQGDPAPTFPTAETTLNTTTCTGGTLVPQDDGPRLCVFRWANVTLPAGRTLIFRGENIPAIVGTESLLIEGTIDVAGHADLGGPAAGPESLGHGSPGEGDKREGGGGGGSAATGGDGGGNPDVFDRGGFGGATILRGDALVPGGFGGIGGPCLFCERLAGGGAGGALYLVGCRGARLGAGARISAGGGGGRGGVLSVQLVETGAGDGGGAGGDVLIEAPDIDFIGGGVIATNGGGGGAGAHGLDIEEGERGEDGRLSTVPASGGPGAGAPGGNGGIATSGDAFGQAEDGAPYSSFTGAGGGGGAAGRIRVRIRPDLPFDIPLSFIVSPEEERGRIERTR